MTFKASSADEKRRVLDRKISLEQRNLDLGSGSDDALQRLSRRMDQIERAWVMDNYVVAKSGSEIKYIAREKSLLGGYSTETIDFAIHPGAEVWVENVFSTGVEDLIQIFLIDDEHRRIYIITWNLQHNREHSLFQTSYGPDVFPENLIIKGKS